MPSRTDNPSRSLFSRIQKSLGGSRSRDFLRFLPGPLSLSGPELLDWIERSAQALGPDRLAEGAMVLVQLSHPLSLVTLLPALWSLGHVPFLLEPSFPANPWRGNGRSPFAALLRDSPGSEGSRIELPHLPPLHMECFQGLHRRALPFGTVLVRTTSGTTGRPRGVALSTPQLLADARNILASLRLGPSGTRSLGAVPLSHAYGFSTLLTPLLCFRIPLTLLESPLPEHFRTALRGSESHFFPGVPLLFDLLLSSGLSSRLLERLNPVISAGAPLTPRTALQFKEKTGIPLRNFYGSSECGAIACDASQGGEFVTGCVGTPLRGVRVSIEELPARYDHRAGAGSGRLLVEGRSVALGYVGPGTRTVRFRGRFRTADLGRKDARGRFFLLGRLDRMINVGGRKVFPEEVERVLGSFPGVRESVVLAVPDSRRGEAVGAAVACGNGLREADLLDYCRAKLPRHGLPRRWIILPALPRTARGKVDLERLRSLFSAPATGASRTG